MKAKFNNVADKLRHYRELCVLSQQQVADALHVDRSTYTKYETGDSEPNLNTIVKLAAIYGVSVTLLLPDDDYNTDPTRLNDLSRADIPLSVLSKDERGIVALYRGFSIEDKQHAYDYLRGMAKKQL